MFKLVHHIFIHISYSIPSIWKYKTNRYIVVYCIYVTCLYVQGGPKNEYIFRSLITLRTNQRIFKKFSVCILGNNLNVKTKYRDLSPSGCGVMIIRIKVRKIAEKIWNCPPTLALYLTKLKAIRP